MTVRLRPCVLVAVLALPSIAAAQGVAPAAPTSMTATDSTWDNGTGVVLTWSASPDDSSLRGYRIRQRQADASEYTLVDIVPPGTTTFTVGNLHGGTAYRFDVAAVGGDGTFSAPAETATTVNSCDRVPRSTRSTFAL